MRYPGHNLYPPTRSKAISLAWLPAAISAASKTAPEGFCTSTETQLRLPSPSKTLLRLPLSNLHLSSNVRRHPLPRSLANGSDIQHSPLGVATAVIGLQANAPTKYSQGQLPAPLLLASHLKQRARAPNNVNPGVTDSSKGTRLDRSQDAFCSMLRQRTNLEAAFCS